MSTLTEDPGLQPSPTLFDPPAPEHLRRMALEDRWYLFKQSNWPLVQGIEADVVQRFHDGATYISMRQVFEDYRGRAKAKEPGSTYELNNDLAAPFSRWLIARHPFLEGVIRTKRSKALKEPAKTRGSSNAPVRP